MTRLSEVHWIDLPSNSDPRGILTSIESGHSIPFDLKRVFYMHHIVTDRGGHAHMDTDQVVTAVSGSFKMDLSFAQETRTFELNNPARGLYIPRMIFTRLYDYSPGAVTLVLANTHYDKAKSLRTWDEYIDHLMAEGVRG